MGQFEISRAKNINGKLNGHIKLKFFRHRTWNQDFLPVNVGWHFLRYGSRELYGQMRYGLSCSSLLIAKIFVTGPT